MKWRMNWTDPRPTQDLQEIEDFENNILNPIIENQIPKELVVPLSKQSGERPMSWEGSPPISQVIPYPPLDIS